MEFIVDTNIVSFIHKGDSRAEPYRLRLQGREVGVSFATVAELYRWTVERGWGQKRIDELQSDLRRYLVLPPDDLTAWEWARIKSIKGHPISSDDAWIAAAARRYNLPIITHNRKHFEHIPGLKVISEVQ